MLNEKTFIYIDAIIHYEKPDLRHVFNRRKISVPGSVMTLKNGTKKVRIDICSKHSKDDATTFARNLLNDGIFFVEMEGRKIQNINKLISKDREKFKSQ